MTHEELEAAVVALINDRGLRYHSCGDGRRCQGQRGLPDLLILGPHGVLFRELKSEDGRCTMAQVQYGRALEHAGLDYAVWRPADLESGRVEAELDSIS